MTNAELAILCLVAEKPRHGYEIEQVIEDRGMREWTEVGFSSIYYLLKKLAEKGLVIGEIQEHSGTGPVRKVFRVTREGRRTVNTGILATLAEPAKQVSPLQIGLANLPCVDKAEAVGAMRSYAETLHGRGEYLRERERAQETLPDHVGAMFSHSLALIEAEREWVRDFIKGWESSNDED
jgi:DNA-binding PadR family transcriptional regulator